MYFACFLFLYGNQVIAGFCHWLWISWGQAETFNTKFCFHSFVGRLWCFSHATTSGLKTQKSKFQSKIKVAMNYLGIIKDRLPTSNFYCVESTHYFLSFFIFYVTSMYKWETSLFPFQNFPLNIMRISWWQKTNKRLAIAKSRIKQHHLLFKSLDNKTR